MKLDKCEIYRAKKELENYLVAKSEKDAQRVELGHKVAAVVCNLLVVVMLSATAWAFARYLVWFFQAE